MLQWPSCIDLKFCLFGLMSEWPKWCQKGPKVRTSEKMIYIATNLSFQALFDSTWRLIIGSSIRFVVNNIATSSYWLGHCYISSINMSVFKSPKNSKLRET